MRRSPSRRSDKDVGWDRPDQGQCQWRRDRPRTPDRRFRHARAGHAAARDARAEAKKGLATLCIGGGMGIALCVERD